MNIYIYVTVVYLGLALGTLLKFYYYHDIRDCRLLVTPLIPIVIIFIEPFLIWREIIKDETVTPRYKAWLMLIAPFECIINLPQFIDHFAIEIKKQAI